MNSTAVGPPLAMHCHWHCRRGTGGCCGYRSVAGAYRHRHCHCHCSAESSFIASRSGNNSLEKLCRRVVHMDSCDNTLIPGYDTRRRRPRAVPQCHMHDQTAVCVHAVSHGRVFSSARLSEYSGTINHCTLEYSNPSQRYVDRLLPSPRGGTHAKEIIIICFFITQ